MRTGAGVYIAGFAASKSKTKVLVEGGSASVRFDAAQPIALIVRAKDNKADPMSIVRVFRMKSTKKTPVGGDLGRRVVLGELQHDGLPAVFGREIRRKPYRRRSTNAAAEYGIIVSNPNNVGREDGDRLGVRHRRRSRGERVSRNHTVPISAVQSDSAPFLLIAEQVKSP